MPNEHIVAAPLTTGWLTPCTLVRPPTVGGVDDTIGADACPFCAIAVGRAVAEVVWADDDCVAFLDRSPLFPGHTLVVPRVHVVTLADLRPEALAPLFAAVQRIAAAMPGALGCEGTFVANNNVVSQSVAHLHVHVVPRTRGDGLRGFFWPRRKYADGEAADITARLRGALGVTP